MTDLSNTLDERGARYGDFSDHARIAQDVQDVMRNTPGWANLDATKRQALTVIADKIARILNGDPEYVDNWHDIQGYAKLAEDRCTQTLPFPEAMPHHCEEAGGSSKPAVRLPDGWIEWSGGECPVAKRSLVEIRLRYAPEKIEGPNMAGNLTWAHGGTIPSGYELIGYKVVDQ